jgi:hypothetical protein
VIVLVFVLVHALVFVFVHVLVFLALCLFRAAQCIPVQRSAVKYSTVQVQVQRQVQLQVQVHVQV